MDPVLQDDRITSIGLLFEATSAVRAAIERRGGLPNNHEVLLRLARSPGQRLRMTDLAAQAGLTPAVFQEPSTGSSTRASSNEQCAKKTPAANGRSSRRRAPN